MSLPEVKISCSIVNASGQGVSGTLFISDRQLVFKPSALMKILVFWNKWTDLTIDIKHLVGYKKMMMGYISLCLYDGSTYQFNVFKKDILIHEINKRRMINSYAELKAL